ncbi:MAG: DNA polymerase III subunit gamma/tau [Clostridia bacterium]
MAYQALYRKYRPSQFSDVLGQEHIVTILKNQLATGHVSHAYLFAGTRGTGKTTMAKIFARAVNCLSPVESEPCGSCSACLENESGCVDILEFDAASNNGVEDMRSLIERAVFSPITLKNKVYIIDEAHMLSKSAFDSLLKTLEEPPAHVLFILATTEAHKIPATIISRCQRFDFRRLSVENMIKCIESILEQTNSTIDREGLLAISRAADGAMRDAISLADQCLSFCGNHVTAEDVYNVLGCMDKDFMFEIAELLAESNADGVLRALDKIVRAGRDLSVFSADLLFHFRALLFSKLCGSCTDILDCTEDAMKRYLKQSKSFSKEKLERAMDMLSDLLSKLRFFPAPRVLLDMALIKICRPDYEDSMLSLVERLNALESGVAIKKSAPSVQTQNANSKKSTYVDDLEQYMPSPPPSNNPYPDFASFEAALPEEKNSKNENQEVSSDNDDGILENFKNALKKLDIMARVAFSQAIEYKLLDDAIIVSFDSKTHYNTAMSAKDDAQAILNSLCNGMILLIKQKESEKENVSERARLVFGDKLSID